MGGWRVAGGWRLEELELKQALWFSFGLGLCKNKFPVNSGIFSIPMVTHSLPRSIIGYPKSPPPTHIKQFSWLLETCKRCQKQSTPCGQITNLLFSLHPLELCVIRLLRKHRNVSKIQTRILYWIYNKLETLSLNKKLTTLQYKFFRICFSYKVYSYTPIYEMISFMSCLKVKFSNIVFRLVRNSSRIIYYIFFWKICLLLIPSPKTINAKMMWKFLHKPFEVCCVSDLIIKIIFTWYKLPKIFVTF